MEPPGVLPPDKEKERYLLQQQLHQQQLLQLQQHQPQQHSIQQLQLLNQQQQQFTVPSPNQLTTTTSIGVSATAQQTIERLSRPMAFDKMEILVREMQDSEVGVPVRSQKLFLTSIPSAFMGYDLIEWLMERLGIEESEALNLANQLCLHGYFFPVNDSKTLVVKDDSSLYRFQTPYYWPWQHKAPDNVEYAIYLAKRSLRNKQRHGLEDYESEALTSLHKNLKGKWDFITMQAEEQVKLAKERKKGDKIVGDSQERAYWRVHRPPPGQFTPLEPCPVPSRDRQGKPRRRTVDDWQRDVDFLKASLGRTRMKMSQACESLVQYYEIFTEYDPLMQPALPSNPWVTEDITFWQQNSNIVDVPTEKRIKRWGISIEELVSDPTGLQEFTAYLKKEYSHENIRFWLAVNDLRRSAHSQIPRKVKEIYEEFLEPGAPCEINIDSKTMEKVQQGLKSPTRFTFDAAAEHIYALLLKKDCYPRFIRSEHYKLLLASGLQPAHKKRFFVFGGVAKKKSTTIPPNQALLNQIPGSSSGNASGNLGRRRGSDRSLSGSAHELAVSGVKDGSSKVPHSHSQSNLSDIPYRGDMPSGGSIIPEQSEVPINVVASALPGGYDKTKTQEPSKSFTDSLETTLEGSVGGNGSGGGACAICPWDVSTEIIEPSISVSVCPWDEDSSNTVPMPIGPSKSSTAISTRPTSASPFDIGSTTQDINEVSERMRRSCGLRQNTLDCDFPSSKRLMPAITEQRRASVTIAPRSSDLQFSPRQSSLGIHGIFSSAPLPFTENYSASQLSLPISTLLGIEDKSGNSGGKKKSSVATEETMKKGTKGSTTSGIASTSANNVLKQQQKISSSTDESFIDSKKNLPSNNFVEKETIINDDNDEAKTINILSNKNNEVLSNNKNSVNYNISSSSLSSELTGLVPSQLMITATMTSSPSSQGTTPIINVCPIVDEEEELKIIAEQQQFQQESSGQQEITEMTDDNKSLMTESSQANIPSFSSSSSPSTITQGTVSTPTATIVEEEDETTNLPSNKMMMINVKSDLNIQDELSPTTDDYRECVQYQEQNTSEDYDYEIVDEGGNNLAPGCVAPAPTPAPSIAPLAEVEQDPQDDDDDDDDNNDNNTVDNVICGHEDVDVEITTSQPDVAIAAGNDDDDDNIRTGNVRIDDDDNDNGGDTSRQQSVEIEEVEMKPETSAAAAAATDVTRKKRKKRDSESKRSADDLKEQPKKDDQQMTHDIQTTTTSKASKDEDPKRNPVCPWEDEDMSGTVDAPFVKTYATLGYL